VQNAGDHLFFIGMRPHYLRDVAKLPTNEPRLKVFNWGGIFGVSEAVV